jgi:non-heme chloroperoxidase
MATLTVGRENNADINLYYEDHGTGQPVVLIHGYPLNGHSWEKQEHVLLEAGYRVITYDRRGFGASSQPVTGYDYDTFAADLKKLLDHLDVNGVVLGGFSMGTGEVTRYLGTYGSARIVLDNLYNADTFAGTRVSDQDLQSAFITAVGASAHATWACANAWLTDFRADLPKSDVPTLLVHGNADRILPYAVTAARLPGLTRDLQFVTIDGGPHNVTWTHASEVNAALLQFIRAESLVRS